MNAESKRDVLGVLIDAVDLETAADRIIEAAESHASLSVAALAVHGVMIGARDPDFRNLLNSFGLAVPDGQPVRLAINFLHGTNLSSSVRGTDLTRAVLDRAAGAGLPVYFYGSRAETLGAIAARLDESLPTARIAGMAPSLFRDVTPEELADIAERIRASGARIVLVGLGCPRQEKFTAALCDLIELPVMAVGAAFDYLAGTLNEPPAWVRRFSLEWLWRLALEPRRLWRRYLLLNPAYVAMVIGQRIGLWHPSTVHPSPRSTSGSVPA